MLRPLRRQAHPLLVQFDRGLGVGEFLNDLAVFEVQAVDPAPSFVFVLLTLDISSRVSMVFSSFLA